MIPNDLPRYNPWSDCEREWKEYENQIEREYKKIAEEFERPFKEFEYQMKELDRLAAEIDELMKIPEIEEFNKMMKAYDRFFTDPERYKELIDRIIISSGMSPSEFYKYIHDRIRKSKSLDSSDY